VGFLRFLGSLVTGFLQYLGEVAMLFGQIFESLVKGKIRWRLVLQQIVEIGHRSQPVVMVTGAFTGAVLAAQSR
jgi:phospholipid/cholesterol/gamma-HCH transport system permease protein